MKRLITYLLISVITFFVGVTIGALFKRQGPRQVQNAHAVESMTVAINKPTPDVANISTPESKIVWDYDVDRFNPRGVYFILGDKPKRFPEFDCLELAVYPNQEKAEGRVTIQIIVNHTYEEQYAVSALVTEHGLSFSTISRTDIQCDYAFDGYFLRTGVLSTAGKHEAVLEGRLTKSKNGVRLAGAKVRFRVEYLGC